MPVLHHGHAHSEGDKTSVAVAFLNKWTAGTNQHSNTYIHNMYPHLTPGTPLTVAFTLTQLGLDHPQGYRAVEVFRWEGPG